MPQLDFLFAVNTSQRGAKPTTGANTQTPPVQATSVALLINHSTQHFSLGGPALFPAGFDLGGWTLANLSRRFLNSALSRLPFSPEDLRFVIVSEGIFLSDRRALNPFLGEQDAHNQPKIITAQPASPIPSNILNSLRELVATRAGSGARFTRELGLFLSTNDAAQRSPAHYTAESGRDCDLAIPYVRTDPKTGEWDLSIAFVNQRLRPWSTQIKPPVSYVVHFRPVDVEIGGIPAVTLSINVTPVYGRAPSMEKVRQFVAHIFPRTLVEPSKSGSETPPLTTVTTVSRPAADVSPNVVSLRSFVRRAPDGSAIITTTVVEENADAERDAQIAAVIAASQDPANHFVTGGEYFAGEVAGTPTTPDTAPTAAVIPFVRMLR